MKHMHRIICVACMTFASVPAVAGSYYSNNYTPIAQATNNLGGLLYLGIESHHLCKPGERLAWGETAEGRLVDTGCWTYEPAKNRVRIAWHARAGKPAGYYNAADLDILPPAKDLASWVREHAPNASPSK